VALRFSKDTHLQRARASPHYAPRDILKPLRLPFFSRPHTLFSSSLHCQLLRLTGAASDLERRYFLASRAPFLRLALNRFSCSRVL